MNIARLSRYVLSTFLATAFLAGCGGSQLGSPGTMPQNAGLPITSPQTMGGMVPDAACPVAGGKKYTTGKGHVSMKFWQVETTAPSHQGVAVYLIYSGWKKDRPLVRYTTKLFTCGPQGDAKPIGQLGRCCGGSHVSKCRNGVCTETFTLYVDYKIDGALPSKKPWKYDYVKFVPEKNVAGFGALPALRIQVNP